MQMKIQQLTLNRNGRHARQGFTLVELLLVLVILGTLAAIVLPRFTNRTKQAQIAATQTQIAAFKTALDHFEVDNGYYPKGKNGLLDLIQQPRDAQSWRGPYLSSDTVPKDPWGNEYKYVSPAQSAPYEIISLGADGKEGGEGPNRDIASSQQ